MTDFTVRTPAQLASACAAVQPGDIILVHGGLYNQCAKLEKKRGTRARPITIRAADKNWISGGTQPDPFWGHDNTDPAKDSPPKPGITDFAFLVIDRCAHIVIESLMIRECWPSILFVSDTTQLTVRDCNWRHATYAIFAKGSETSHLLIERNQWQQDDSANHALWSEIDWRRAHGNEGSDGLYRYFNGGFFSAKGIRGNTIFRGNCIMDAYNGIRIKAGDAPPSSELASTVNANIHIFDNDFIRIRDNPIEPEVCAFNWHVRHNRLLDCHSWFSFDGVTGGFWYFYGNTSRFQSRQGLPVDDKHTMGRVLKLSYEMRPRDRDTERVPVHPWFVFNNSWYLRCPVVGGANAAIPADGEGPDFTAHLTFFNNALAWCDRNIDDGRVCADIEPVRHFDMPRTTATLFDYDISNHADFIDFFRQPLRGERNGVVSMRSIFESPRTGDFALAQGSEALRSGWRRGVALQMGSADLLLQADGTLNRGAAQDYGLIKVPELELQATVLLAEMETSD